MAVKIRMKKLGRRHRPFFRICAIDSRKARDGRVIEELGYYDPMVKETDARAVLKSERIDYWLGVGAQPSDKVRVLIKKYGTDGTHLEQQQAAFDKLKIRPAAPPPVTIELPKPEEPAAEATTEAPPAEPVDESTSEPAAAEDAAGAEASAEESPAKPETNEEAPTEEEKTE